MVNKKRCISIFKGFFRGGCLQNMYVYQCLLGHFLDDIARLFRWLRMDNGLGMYLENTATE